MIAVDSTDQLRGALLDLESALVVGNRSKPPLSATGPETRLISVAGLTGMVEYESSEFTFTARAGTPLTEIVAALKAKRQYLPLDPMLIDRGATLGGTVASGISGPGRHRYGGVRDFVLGVQFISGDGQLFRGGGKVVKNAAGFDLPKLLVGSCGRLAAMTELTFKVFPRPAERHTYRIECRDHRDAAECIAITARRRWEADAIDYRSDQHSVWIRLAGTRDITDQIAADIRAAFPDHPIHRVDTEQAEADWKAVTELRFAGPGEWSVIKIPLTLERMIALAQSIGPLGDAARLHVSAAGSIGWLAIDHDSDDANGWAIVNQFLADQAATGLVVTGSPPTPDGWLMGHRPAAAIESAIKQALDPPGRFPDFGAAHATSH